MGYIFTITLGFGLWILLWALGWKPIDAFLFTALILVVGSTLKILAGYLPGRRRPQ